MPGELQPLDEKFAIVDDQGRPTRYFTQWAQQKQIDIGDSITLEQAQELLDTFAAGRQIIAGRALDGGGYLSSDVTIDHAESLVVPGTYGDATHVPQFVVDQEGHIQGVVPVLITGGGGGGGSTPTIRASNIQSSSANTYTVTWPAGTIAGDVVIIFGAHGFIFNNPANWIVLDNENGTNTNGVVLAKVMTAADITAGSVNLTTTGVFNGVIAAITITGTTMAGIHQPSAFVRNSAGPAIATATSVVNFSALSVDLILVFAASRVAGNITFSAGITGLQAINAASASGALGKFTGTLTPLGMAETWQSSVAGSGYYSAAVALRGP